MPGFLHFNMCCQIWMSGGMTTRELTRSSAAQRVEKKMLLKVGKTIHEHTRASTLDYDA